MSLGTPINWGAPTASPSAQPEAFRYGGEGYVRMGDGKILQTSQYLSQQSALNTQNWIDSAARYDPDEPLRQAARAMEAQPYKSPTTGAPVSREQFFREQSRLSYQASNQYDSAMRARLANAPTAWDTPLPRGVTVDMIPTGPGAFEPAPTAGAIVPARRGAPVGEALRTPVNAGVKPRIPALSNSPATSNAVAAGVLSGAFGAYGAYSGGAGFFEGAGAGVGGLVGGGLGGLGGAALGASAGAGAGTFALPVVGTVSGGAVGGYVGGGLGAAAGGSLGGGLGRGIGRAIDNLIPDFLDPPNALDPAAMAGGEVITPGTPPPFIGGQSPGVLYTIKYTVDGQQVTGVIPSVLTYGPISGLSRQTTPGPGPFGEPYGVTYPGTANGSPIWLNLGGANGRWVDPSRGAPEPKVSGITITRADGQPDTGGNPPGGTEPIRAPNPARRTSTPEAPRNLPSPTPPPADSDLPWPQAPARETPDTTPLSPPAPAPNLTETPTETTTPPTTEEPSDPLNPSKTPPDLSTPGKTPPVSDLSKSLGGSSGKGFPTPDVLEVVIPIILLEGLRQRANTPTGNLVDRSQPNPNVQITKAPPVQTATKPNPPTCIYEQQRVMDIQNKATDTQQRSANPVSGFPGLYGLQIESRTKLGQTFDLLGTVDQFARKAWETTRMQKILDVLTFVGVMHNASMLSREVGETFLELVGQGLQAVGIRDEKNEVIDVNEVVSENVEGLLKNTLGVERYNGISAAWNKANRIVSSASSVIWTVRSIADATQDLSEWTAENTGRIGNALKRWGVVGENAYPTMSESAKAQHRMRTRFDKFTGAAENVEDRLSTYTQATSSVIEIQEETSELTKNFGDFKKSVVEGIPDPWADNLPIKEADDQDKADSIAPPINVADSQKG